MTENRVADKRPLDRDDDDGGSEPVENVSKKSKLLLPPSSPTNSPIMKDVRKLKLLPSIVYELLALIKKSEKPEEKPEPDDGHVIEQKKISNDNKEEIKVLPSSNRQNKFLDIDIKHENFGESHGITDILDKKHKIKLLNNTEESNKLLIHKSSVEDSVQNLKDINLPTDETEIGEAQKETTLNTKTSVVKYIANVLEESKIKDEKYEKANISQQSTNAEYISSNCDGYRISKTENLFILSQRQQLLNLLNNCCVNGMSEIPTTKPHPCDCKYCVYASNLPRDKFAVNNLFTSDKYSDLTNDNTNYNRVPTDMYEAYSDISISDSSVCAKNDCSCVSNSNSKHSLGKNPRIVETSKNIWVNELISLIRKNELIKESEVGINNSKSLSCIEKVRNKICNVTKLIKTPFCNICKRSKSQNSYSVCKCSRHNFKNQKLGDIPRDIPTIVNRYGHKYYKNERLS